MTRPLLRDVDSVLLVTLLLSCLLLGGGSRLDILSLVILDPIAIVCLAVLIWRSNRDDIRIIRGALVLVAVAAAIIIAQLIPLPPRLWNELPGHAQFVQIAEILGRDAPWRPLSIAPDLTQHALIALVAPFCAFMALTRLRSRRSTAFLVPLLLCMIASSAMFALFQLSGGDSSPFYIYNITSRGSATGLLANRNHAAVFLALAMPLLASWPKIYPRAGHLAVLQWSIAASAVVFIFPLILITGSRAGLLFALLGAAASLPLLPSLKRGSKRRKRKWPFWGGISALLVAVVAVSAGVLTRAEAINRLFRDDLTQDLRERIFPTLIELIRVYFPTGAGFGTFDPVYRVIEPLTSLEPRYVNHAHNDAIELLIEAGLPGLILLLTFLAWWSVRAWAIWRSPIGESTTAALARVGTIITAILLMSSLADYPLRTPLLAVVFAVACGWMWNLRPAAKSSGPDTPDTRPALY